MPPDIQAPVSADCPVAGAPSDKSKDEQQKPKVKKKPGPKKKLPVNILVDITECKCIKSLW